MSEKLNIEIIGSTKPGFVLLKDEALKFGAHNAGICYMNNSFQDILNEAESKNLARQELTLSNGHQSVYGHPNYNVLISGIPKILAMVLNNEKIYVTSEKSARYTKMDPTPKEKELYDKWLGIFEKEIEKKYSFIDEKKITKLAQENARYVTSVFTPTTMSYTAEFRQLNYLMHWFDEFIKTEDDTDFNKKLKGSMNEFNQTVLKDLYVEDLSPKVKERNLSLFSEELPEKEIFETVYSTNYEGSFAQLAQAHRHRTINYQMKSIKNAPDDFFIPFILSENKELVKRWEDDLHSVAEIFPQGTKIQINERGIFEDFVSKGYERLCGHAQLEIALQTKETLHKYMDNTSDEKIYQRLNEMSNGPRCTFKDYDCTSGCNFGKKALERLI